MLWSLLLTFVLCRGHVAAGQRGERPDDIFLPNRHQKSFVTDELNNIKNYIYKKKKEDWKEKVTNIPVET